MVLLIAIVWASIRERRWIADFLEEEVRLGTLSRQDYEVACSYLKRVAVRTNALLKGDLRHWWRLGRYYRLVTELAFSRHRLAQFREERDTQERILKLRQQLGALETWL